MENNEPGDEHTSPSAASLGWISQPPRGHPDTGTTGPEFDVKWSCSSLPPRQQNKSASGVDGDELRNIKGLEEGRCLSLSHARGEITPRLPSHQPSYPSVIIRMASFLKPFLACALFLFALAQAGVATHRGYFRDSQLRPRSGPVVTVKNGSYEGVYSSEYSQDFFLGMRYAQVRPPITGLGDHHR